MPPKNDPQRPDQGKYYKQVSNDDPLSNPPTITNRGNFDFMLKDQQKAKSKFGLPSNMGKPAKLVILSVIVLVVVIIAASVLGGGNSNSNKVVDLVAQAQEINRIGQLRNLQFQDINNQNLAATTRIALESQQADYGTYLASFKIKYTGKDLATHVNTNTDKQLQTAAQNNNFDSAYLTYLNGALLKYRNSIQKLYKSTQSKTLKADLQSAFSSVQTILSSPQFKG